MLAALARLTTSPPLQVGSTFTQHALQGIALPVALALAAKLLLPGATSAVAKYAPAAAACCILATASNKTALAAGVVKAAGPGIAAWVFAWHAAALALGYAGARALGADERLARTAAIQVGGRGPVPACARLCVPACAGLCRGRGSAAPAPAVSCGGPTLRRAVAAHAPLPRPWPQAGERNPALGLALAAACSSDPLVLAPLAVSVFAQNVLGSNLSVFFWGRRSTSA
jgi:predicted Na+-dependent transporter